MSLCRKHARKLAGITGRFRCEIIICHERAVSCHPDDPAVRFCDDHAASCMGAVEEDSVVAAAEAGSGPTSAPSLDVAAPTELPPPESERGRG